MEQHTASKTLHPKASIKNSIMLAVAVILAQAIHAQNSSYNANAVPIGGTYSTAFGFQSLAANQGPNNSASGAYSLANNYSGQSNTAHGTSALRLNTGGSYNTAIGHDALYYNVSGSNNTAVGYNSLFYSTGPANTAVGTQSLESNSTGDNNSAMGYASLRANTSGRFNTAIGRMSLSTSTIGNSNTAVGDLSLNSNSTGNDNTVLGAYALATNVAGSRNTAIGMDAGHSTKGNQNVFLGYEAGASEAGSNKLYIGNAAFNTILYGDFGTRQILMGNADPAGYVFKGTRTLNVLGGILADSIRVALSGNWSDHVFSTNYRLMPLSEVESYSQSHHHLPGIPSEKEVKENGISVAEINAKLLQKIEELTLYVIDQQKQIDVLNNKIKKSSF